mmetsp:Transcript_24648/g.38322  ORF Transcript_24648/g.38322 Transcript_24648/m.38322 type:complete len:86 (+) Transcript_24648:1422-1679(+)
MNQGYYTRLHPAKTLDTFCKQLEDAEQSGSEHEEAASEFNHSTAEFTHQFFPGSAIVCFHGSKFLEMRWATSSLGIRYSTKHLSS